MCRQNNVRLLLPCFSGGGGAALAGTYAREVRDEGAAYLACNPVLE